MPDRETEAMVEEEIAQRSCSVNTLDGTIRGNGRDLIQVPDNQETSRSTL